MKEKISCSLDGDLVTHIDEIITKYPFIANRSALLETACYLFVDYYNECANYNIEIRDNFVQSKYERRCELNAQKESKNRNV